MDEHQERETFSYTYSAKQQEEIERIRQKYVPKEETKMDQLRRLDQSAERPGRVAALSAGSIGLALLVLGTFCITVWGHFVLGVILGALGILLMLAANPIYSGITKRMRKKLAPEILRLTEELRQ